ncbi:MAG: tetratricopeptide repeat protein [Candidatus Bipolaricaulota bacterium]|nr:tetratricopeptide repeat protein [Candidatus Bipolaricaulota bacterium]MDW8030852.1 tetratricopeptide repeat protein [Candidatus Bipolaricaulota bacterium]
MLKIFLFGRFSVERDGQLLGAEAWRNAKTKTLLKVLASERGRVFSVDELIEYLWPGEEPDLRSAASNLRSRIAELRKLLEPSLERGEQSRYILTRRGGYLLAEGSDCWLDIEEFSRCEERGHRAYHDGNFDEAIGLFEQALALYRGEYLAEDRYEEWTFQTRERFRERSVEILSLLADCLARRGQYRSALGYLERALAESPLDEKLYRQMMVYAFCAGEKARAHQAYERCRAVLERELGESPSSQTEEIYRQIQSARAPEWERFYPRAGAEGVALPEKIRRPPFVGRVREWEQLTATLSRVCAGAGHFVLILGEAGVGKTRLSEEFLRWAQEHKRALTLCGRCYELENSIPFSPWVEALRQGIPHISRTDLGGVPPAWLAELAEMLPELGRVVPDLPPAPLSPEHRQYRIFETLYRVISSLALRHAPLVVFIDDLQWADSRSIDFLCYLLERMASEPVLLVGAARSEELSSGVERVRHHGVRLGRLSEMTLSRLSEREIYELVQSLADAIETPADFGGRLYRASWGNPLYATTVLQALFENGAFVAEGPRWRLSDPSRVALAPSAVQLLERRVKRAGMSAQRILQIVACAVQLDLEVLETIWDGPAEELFAHLAELQGLVVEREGRYELAHEMFRNIVYESLERPRRVWLHRRIAQAIEKVYADPVAAGVADRLAWHYEQGGQPRKALAWILKAIDEHQRRFHIEEGLRSVELGLLVLRKLRGRFSEEELAAQKFSLIIEQLNFYLKSGQVQAAQQSCHQALVLAEQLGLNEQAQAFGWNASCLIRAARYEDALRSLQTALALNPPNPKVRANLFSQLGLVYFCRGEYRSALEYYQKALEIFRIRDPLQAAYTWNDCANALMKLGEYQQALMYYERALRLYRELHELHKASAVLNNIGATLRYLGQYHRARQYLEQACDLDRRHGDRRGLAYSLCNLAQTYRLLGEPAQALKLSTEAHEIFSALEDPLGQCMMQRWIGVVYRDLGQHERALTFLRQALDHARTINAQSEEGACLVELAHTLLDIGQDTQEAIETLRQALALIEQHRWSGELVIRAYYLYYRALKALHHPHAAEAWRRAYEELQRTAQQLTDDSLRRSFLEIPFHQHILHALDSPPHP